MWLEWLPISKFLVWDDVVSCSDFLFGIFDMCFIRQCSVQCDANIHLEYDTVVPATSGHLRFGAKVALRGRWPFVAGNINS